MSFVGRGCHLAGLALGLAALPAVADAQEQSPRVLELSLSGGPSDYDLSGTGTALILGAQLPWRAAGPVIVEPGVFFLTYSSQFDTRTSYLMPEVGLQLQGELNRVRPFIGGGLGAAFGIQGPSQTDLTLHATGGVRVDLGRNWGLRGELRIHSIDPFHGTTADFLFGVSRRLR